MFCTDQTVQFGSNIAPDRFGTFHENTYLVFIKNKFTIRQTEMNKFCSAIFQKLRVNSRFFGICLSLLFAKPVHPLRYVRKIKNLSFF